MIFLDVSSWTETAMGGTMLLAAPIAFAAGLVSFFSPCVLPLLPGYLAYATGLGAADVLQGRSHRGRLVIGSALFVLGFAVVFTAYGTVAGALGQTLLVHQATITRVLGVLVIVLGLIFAGVLPLGRRELRLQRLPAAGIAVAPLLGVVFAIGWTPCIGPVLGVVLNLGYNEATAVRGALLAFVFALGLGLPFVLAGLAYPRLARAVGVVRRHQQVVLRLGGVLMVAVGVLLVTGVWDRLMIMLVGLTSSFRPVI